MGLFESKYSKAKHLNEEVLMFVNDVIEAQNEFEATKLILNKIEEEKDAILKSLGETKPISQKITKSSIESIMKYNDWIVEFYEDSLSDYFSLSNCLKELALYVFNDEDFKPHEVNEVLTNAIDFCKELNSSIKELISVSYDAIDSSIKSEIAGIYIQHKKKIESVTSNVNKNINITLYAITDRLAFIKLLYVVENEISKISTASDYDESIEAKISESIKFLLSENDKIKEERSCYTVKDYPSKFFNDCIEKFDKITTANEYLEFLDKIVADCKKNIENCKEVSSTSNYTNRITSVINSAFGI